MKKLKFLFLNLLFFSFIINVNAKETIKQKHLDKFNNIILTSKDETIKENEIIEGEYNGLYEEYLKLSDEQKAALGYEPSYKYKTLDNNMLLLRNNLNNSLISASIPSTYDLRNLGYAPAMRDQGPFGLCWAFTFNSMLESYLLRKGYSNASSYNFSEIAADIQQKILFDYELVNGNYNLDSEEYYRYTIGVTQISNALLNWTYYNPVLEGNLGTSSTSSNLLGKDYTYDNIASAYINKYKQSGSENAYYFVEEIMNEINTSKVTSRDNSPFNVSAGLLVAYYSDLLMQDIPNLTASLKANVKEKIDVVKEYIISSGAAATMTVVPRTLGTENSDVFVHNNFLRNNLASYISDKSAHAVTIIGWDDNYGDINNDGVGDGAWIIQNSWGEENNAAYFYLSYYDVFSLQGIYGINNLEENTSDNLYRNINIESKYNATNDAVYQYNYFLGNNKENIDMLKVYFNSNYAKNVSAVISDNVNTCNSDVYFVRDGISSLKFTDCILSGDINVIITTKNSIGDINHSFDDKVDAVLYTSDNTIPNVLEFEIFEEYSSQIYKNYLVNNELSEIYYKIAYDRDIDIDVSLLKVKVLDDDQNDITNKFIYDFFFELEDYLNYGLMYIYIYDSFSTSNINIEIYYNNDKIYTSNFILEEVEVDYENEMIKINEPIDIIALNGYPMYAKYILNNNINLNDLTKTGGIFEGGINLNSIDLNFNGNGKTISGYQSTNGGLFESLLYSNIYNLKLDNFNITTTNTAGILSDRAVESNFTRIYIDNSKITSDTAGGLIGENILSNITDIIVEDTNVTGSSYAGGIYGSIFYDEYLDSNNTYMNYIKNAFVNNLTLYGYKNGILVGKNNIIVEESTISSKEQFKNIMYLNTNVTNYFGEIKVNIYNGNTHTTISNNTKFYDMNNYNLVLDADINSSENKFESFGTVSWKIENNNWPQLKCFIDGYTQLQISEILSKNGDILNDYYYIIDPVDSVKEFVSSIDLYTSVYDDNNKSLDINSENMKVVTGYSVVFDDGISIKNYIIIVRGDINKDGIVDILDFKISSNYLISSNPNSVISGTQSKIAADIDGNDVIDILDFKRISNYLLSESF